MPKTTRKPAIQLVETRRGRAMLETTSRYDVLLNGVLFDQLYWNMRGYVGYLPTPSGSKLSMPEGSLASYKREAARLNREFANNFCLRQLFRGPAIQPVPASAVCAHLKRGGQ